MRFRIPLFLLLTVATFIIAQPTSNVLPFTVDCADDTAATLTISNDYILAGFDGCQLQPKIYNESFKTYHLDEECLANGTFLVEHIVKTKQLVLAEESQLFEVECREDKGIVVQVNSNMSVGGITGVPFTETFTSKPLPAPPVIDLFLLQIDPKTTNGGLGDFENNALQTAYLGQRVYLSLFANEIPLRDKVLNLYPLSCEASTEGVDPVTLWQLHNTSNGDECFMERSVLKTPFALEKGVTHHFSVAEIEAFRFTKNQDGVITFSCSVRVCRQDGGFCHQERKSLESCGRVDGLSTTASLGTTVSAVTPANPVRRRRDIGSYSQEGKVHRVSATLRVTGDLFAHDGSTSVHNTASSLMLIVLTMFFM